MLIISADIVFIELPVNHLKQLSYGRRKGFHKIVNIDVLVNML